MRTEKMKNIIRIRIYAFLTGFSLVFGGVVLSNSIFAGISLFGIGIYCMVKWYNLIVEQVDILREL